MEGWTEHNSRCFFLSADTKEWLDARTYCIDKGGDLAVVLSEGDQKFLTNLTEEKFKSNVEFNGTWIGLHDMDQEGAFQWVNGKRPSKKYWVNGQPDNQTHDSSLEGADCVVLVFELNERTDQTFRNWDDIACIDQRNYICESKVFIELTCDTVLRTSATKPLQVVQDETCKENVNCDRLMELLLMLSVKEQIELEIPIEELDADIARTLECQDNAMLWRTRATRAMEKTQQEADIRSPRASERCEPTIYQQQTISQAPKAK
ncbi:hypothetical protein JOB18_031577 [Solea senegalensis]|uniref:C-type lectin domain-containing protein n=1 Tax=Solea senegalensis TaxID=28829 RepID=A0AAV6RU11_SOLSE|nr:hypothetical protein JOB18_031577 [Solea senegalensis]